MTTPTPVETAVVGLVKFLAAQYLRIGDEYQPLNKLLDAEDRERAALEKAARVCGPSLGQLLKLEQGIREHEVRLDALIARDALARAQPLGSA